VTALIEGRNLSRVFDVRSGVFGPRRPLRAVDDVSIAIEAGETVALVGESGSGKSTLGRMLLGLLPPTAGAILYDGKPINALRGADWKRFRREVQVVFQDTATSLNPRKTIGASLEVPLRYNLGLDGREARERAGELLSGVGLDPTIFLGRYPHELSGGQRQRVGVARAIASRPRFVVADEPVSALDVSVQAQVLKLLRDLQQSSNLAELFITHDLGVVRAVASQVLVMYLGSLVEHGPVAALFAAPGHPYTRALLAATPVPDPLRRQGQRGLGGEIPSPLAPPPGCRFHPRCPFVQDVCRTTPPPLVPLPNGLESACHFASDIQALGAPKPTISDS
jgi:oligopeptide/dipeptide ABC transporter ATP-binding protein